MIISQHATRRAEERGISLHQIEQTLQKPEGITGARFRRKAAFKRETCMVVVVVEEQKVK